MKLYNSKGVAGDGWFRYAVVDAHGKTYFFHRKSELSQVAGTRYQWNKATGEYEAM